MEVRTIIMLIHPLLAAAFVLWLVRQYGWRKKGMTLKGDERKQALIVINVMGSLFYGPESLSP